MSTEIRIGVVGAGRIGRIHAENLSFRVPGVKLHAIFDPVRSAAEECAACCRIPRVADDARRLIEDPELDAIVICSPTGLHAEQIERCASARKAIFCEKPIDLELDRVDHALACVARAGVPLQLGFNRRFDPGFRRARAIVAEGRIGTPQLVRITSRDPQPPPAEYVRGSGGMFLDMTIHDFDMARWIIGSEVVELHTFAAVLVDPAIGEAGDIDTAVVSLRYASGALGAIDNSRKAVYGYDQRLEVFGSEGCVVVGNVPPTTAILSDRAGVTADLPLHFFLERYQAAYLAEMIDFVECLRAGRAPSVSGQDGRAPVLMALAAERSRREGRPVPVVG
jgi:myo-inositol 2-dehydrogenase/D-chiro-inositol 1-dehydrogenase